MIAATQASTGTIRAKSQHELEAVEQNWQADDARKNWGSAFADATGATQAFKGFTGTDAYKGSVNAYQGQSGWHRPWDATVGSLEVIGNAFAFAGSIAAGTSALASGRTTVSSAWQSTGAWARNTEPLAREFGAAVNAVKNPLQTTRAAANVVREGYVALKSTLGELTSGGARQTAQRAWNSVRSTASRFGPSIEREGFDLNIRLFNEGTLKQSVLANIGESRAAREASKFRKYGEFDRLYKLSEGMDVSTARNQAVFYSGRFPLNRDLAQRFARENSKLTIEMTPGGKYFDDLDLIWRLKPSDTNCRRCNLATTLRALRRGSVRYG